MSLNNFRASVSILTTCGEAGMITRVQLLEGPPPKICEGQKTSKFLPDFWQVSSLIANISGTDRHVKHLKKNFINHYIFHVGRKKSGELWTTNKKVLVAHSDQPKWTFFWRQHFGHYAVMLSQFFTLVTDWPRLPSPSPNGDRGPPQKI